MKSLLILLALIPLSACGIAKGNPWGDRETPLCQYYNNCDDSCKLYGNCE